jgi:hypothetical protein
MGSPSYAPNPVLQGKIDYQFTPLYDTYVAASASAIPTSFRFFDSRTISTSGIQVTNKKQANSLENPEAFTVMGLEFELTSMLVADIKQLIQNFAVRLWIASKIRLEAPISFFPQRGGIFGFDDTATTFNYSNGMPNGPQNVFSLVPYQIRIPYNTSFYVEVLGAPSTANWSGGVFMRAYLNGVYEKAVG